MTAPEPLTSPDCDLRDYPWMPLDVRRLLTSETWMDGPAEGKVAALSLWCEAWCQVPAGSLPDNDRILEHLSQARAAWPKVRVHALRGWVKCSDGRLYHPVVCQKANEAWAMKLAQKARTEAARKAKHERKAAQSTNGSTSSVTDFVTDDVTEPATEIVTRLVAEPVAEPVTGVVTDNVTGSTVQDKTVQDLKKEKEDRSLRSLAQKRPQSGFDVWWERYPRKVAKDRAHKAYDHAIKRGATASGLVAALEIQRWPEDRQFIPYPASWLNAGSWQDDPEAAAPPPQPKFVSAWDQLREGLNQSRLTIDHEEDPYARTH